MLLDELRAAGAPLEALKALEQLEAETENRSGDHFNDLTNLKAATNAALECFESSIRQLADRSLWEQFGGLVPSARKQLRECAQLCALKRAAPEAVRILHLSHCCTPPDERVAERGEIRALLARAGASCEIPEDDEWRLHVAKYLIERGALNPWPAVLLQLASDTGAAAVPAAVVTLAVTLMPQEPLEQSQLLALVPNATGTMLSWQPANFLTTALHPSHSREQLASWSTGIKYKV